METYTVRDVAEEFGVAEATVRTWIKKGDLKAEKFSNRGWYIITEEDLDDFCDNVKGPENDESYDYEDLILDDDTAEDLLLNSVDRMIERLEREMKILKVKLKLAYIAREKLEL